MFQESLINSPLLAALAITLIHFLWQGAVVAMLLKTLLSIISYKKSQVRYALSAMAMFVNLLLPIITFFMVYDMEYLQVTNFVHALPLLDQNFYLEQMQGNVWYTQWLEYLPVIAIVWLAIVIALALKLLIELYNVNRLPLQGCSAVDIALQNRFDDLIVKVGLSKKVALLLSNKTDVPMAIGWLKPVVLLPFSMLSGLTPQQLDMLLLHELAHIRRHDYLVNFFQTLVEILLFFHPAVRWVSKQMRNEREYCSDDIAVQHCESSLAYAHTLADTASLCVKHHHHTIPNMAMAASGGDLKQRVVRLLNEEQHCTKSTDSGKWLASLTILLTVAFLFSRQSLTLPVIDLQSGSISLHNSAAKLNKSALTHDPLTFEQKNTSLASQLLAIDNLNAREVLTSEAKANSLQDRQKNPSINAKPARDELEDTNKILTTPYYNELPIVQVNSTKKKNVAQHHADLKNATQANQNLNTLNTKSTSELAFERTDAKRAKAEAKANSYSQQLASLLNEPAIPQETQITALNKNVYNNSSSQQSAKIAKLTSPRFSHGKLSNSVSEQYRFDHKVIAPRLLSSVEPKYPSAAKRKGIELEVMVEFSIDKNGLVKNIQFQSKSKVNYFRNNIRNAMEQWRFLPAKENGRTVESKMSKIFSFSLLR